MPKGLNVTGTGVIVRDFLIMEGEATISDCLKEVRRICEEHEPPWHYPSAEHFRQYFWKLRKAGLVEETRREPFEQYVRRDKTVSTWPRSSNFHTEKIYYRTVKERRGDPAWSNVQKALYG